MGFLLEFMGQRRPPNGDLLSESPPNWEPLPRMDAQLPLRPWPGFEPLALGDPKATKAQAGPLYHGGPKLLDLETTAETEQQQQQQQQ